MMRKRHQPSAADLAKLTELFQQGLFAEAEQMSRALTKRFPEHGVAWKVLGVICLEKKLFDEALLATNQAVRWLADDAAVYNNLGTIFQRLERFGEAELNFRKALAIAPGYAKALFNLAGILRFNGQLVESEACCRHALAIDPDYTNAHIALGNALELQNKLPEAQVSYKAALELAPDMAALHTDLLHLECLDVGIEPQQLFAEHLAFGENFGGPLRASWPNHANTKDPERRLQVGFVTGDLYNHALANFLEPLFKFLAPKSQLTLHIYYTNALNDEVTQRLRALLPRWNSVQHLSDEALAQKIQTDAIDILIDLSGHTVLNRLLTFARKPAPIQVSWLGYLGTTGLQAMDYYVCDPFWIPPGELDWQFVEKTAYLPTAVVFQPNPGAPPVNVLPALANKYITFGSFNRPNKINDSVVVLWSHLMQCVPRSKMVLGAIDAKYQNHLIQQFERAGIDRDRFSFSPRTSQTDYLALHHQVDFCLDTFPHGGGATTAHAAWMGVPTLCLAGENPASRFGATEMHHLGLDEFITYSIDEFVQRGRYWADHTTELAQVRESSRARFNASPLGQPHRFANNFEVMLRAMWSRWCANLPAEALMIEENTKGRTDSALQPAEELNAQDQEMLGYLYQQARYIEAESLALRMIEDVPENGFALKILASVLHKLGRLSESLELHKKIVELRPNDHEAHFNLASEFHQQGNLDEAAKRYILALGIQPNNAIAYSNLGNILKISGLSAEAEVYCRQAISLDPGMANGHNNLGNALHGQGKFLEAEASYRQALALAPSRAETHNNLAITLKDQGRWQEAKDCFQHALQLKPDWAAAYSNFLYCLSHDVQTLPEELRAAHMVFGERFEAPLRANWSEPANTRDPHRPLHIGFVSADFYDHALTNFLEPVFKALALKSELVLYAYYTHIYEDAATHRMRDSFTHWHASAGLTDAELAEQIRSDGIDILIDLTGHTAHNRLLTFARKPAPVQASWLGYLGTTGLQAMDYYLCDTFWIPPGNLELQLSEKAAYLPGAVVFQPSALSPAVNTLPALHNGHITFGSFNRPNKLNQSVIVLWSMLLKQVPQARMLLAGIPRDSQEILLHYFVQERIDLQRLDFHPRSNLKDYLALHHQVDFCLDAFPFGGGATSAHAAWMGVPTLSLAGETLPSRFGSAMMHQLGLDGFIATDIEDFIAKGVYWSENLHELASIRDGMRARFNASSLGQPNKFANDMAALLRAMWQRRCAELPPAAISIQHNSTDVNDSGSHPPVPMKPTETELEKLLDLYTRGLSDEAESLATLLINNFPKSGLAWKILGLICQSQERYEESLIPNQRATELLPADASNFNNYGVVLELTSNITAAEKSFRQAIGIEPNYGKAWVNLGSLLLRQGNTTEAQACCERALDIDFGDASAHIVLGNALEAQENFSQAQASYYRADMAHEPRKAVAHSNVLYLLNHDALADAKHLFSEHHAFGEKFESHLKAHWPAHINIKDPARQLNIGFVSGDFHLHALTHFFLPLFETLRKSSNLILHAYYTFDFTDTSTENLQNCFAHWHQVSNLNDSELANKIERDSIDILIDLAGHTKNNRLQTFAYKPAPVQASWLGYLGTTGLQAMDYYICDSFWIPPGELDWQFTEKLAYLPAAMVFKSSESSPKVNRLPAREKGYITFGSFNRINKINSSVIQLWSMLMQQVPASRLLIGAIPEENQAELAQNFAHQGIPKGRLIFFPRTHADAYLELHHSVDFCLDTFPHGGGATTAQAAWMGVPTLSLLGETPASRFSASIMHHLDLDDFVATSIEDFVNKGVFWSTNLSELAAIRMTMRLRFSESPMGQTELFAKNFDLALRTMWEKWCAETPASSFELAAEIIDFNELETDSLQIKQEYLQIKTFCIAHKSLEFPLPEDAPIVWLGAAATPLNSPQKIYRAAEISDEFDAWHNFLGGSSGSFLIEKMLCDHSIEWTANDRINIVQYRKFIAKKPMGILSKNYPGMYLIEPNNTKDINIKKINKDILTKYLIPQIINVENIYIQYSASHKISDLLRYTALAIDLKIITSSESFEFLNSSYLIPGGIEFGVYPIPVFMRLIKDIRILSMTFLESNNPSSKSSFQRRALSFCNERLGSYLLLKELKKEYTNIPNEIFGYIHTVTEGGIYYSGAN